MGSIANTMKNLGNGGKRVGTNLVSFNSLSKRSISNLVGGSTRCPLVSQCKNIAEGIADRDFRKVTMNTAILGLSVL